MRMYKDVPEEGELVVVTIDDIHDHSASATIDFYDTHGLIHISEVSRSWVRDIRKKISIGEKSVAQVLEVDNNSINLSLKRVNDRMKREKMSEWKKEQKADKFLQKVADELGVDIDTLYERIAFPFQREYDTCFEGFEHAAMDDLDYDALGIDADVAKAVTAVAKDNISLKNVELEGKLTITVPGSNGIETIRQALDVGERAEIQYVSAPTYSITVWGRNTEDAKRTMDSVVDGIQDTIESNGGEFTFEKK